MVFLLTASLTRSESLLVDSKNSKPAHPDKFTKIFDSPIKGYSCFYGEVQYFIDVLKRDIVKINSKCGLNKNHELHMYIESFKSIARLESLYLSKQLSKADITKFFNSNKELFTKHKKRFSKYKLLRNLPKIHIRVGKYYINRMFKEVKYEMALFALKSRFPKMFILDIGKLLDYYRQYIFFKISYKKNYKQCLPTSIHWYVNIDHIINPWKIKINIEKVIPSSFQINETLLVKGGFSFGFWSIINKQAIEKLGGEIVLFNGFQNNKKTWEIKLKNTKKNILHTILSLNGAKKNVVTDVKCSDLAFYLISVQRDCDHYVMNIVIKSVVSNKRYSYYKYLKADQVEGASIKFMKPLVRKVYLFENFFYTPKVETQLLAETMNKRLYSTVANDSKRCRKSPPTCLYSVKGKCVKCRKPLVVHNGKCKKHCPKGTYMKKHECKPCKKHCKTCTNSKNCKDCHKPTILHDNNCVPKCPKNTIMIENPKTKKKECKHCTKHCKECKNHNSCKKCLPGLYLHDGKCHKNCKKGTYKDEKKGECKPCSKHCKECIGKKKCQVCEKKHFLHKGECVKHCKKGTFPDKSSGICKPCHKTCAKCHNSEKCKKCKKGYHMTHQGKCVTDCKKGTVKKDGKCVPCEKHCKICSATNPKHCSKCDKTTVLKNKKCHPNCGPGHYVDHSRKCKPCTKHCKKCTKDKCLKCKKPYSILKDQHCVHPCPDGHVSKDGKCHPCGNKKQCKKCSPNNVKNCRKCFKPNILYNKQCIPKCPSGTYMQNGTCHKCIKNCHKCNNTTSCKKCTKGHFKKHGKCVKKCGKGYVLIKHKCKPCDTKHCELCSKNSSVCKKCKKPKKMYNNKCVPKCPYGTYDNGKNECKPCSKDCHKCKSKHHCKVCKKPLKNQNGKCVKHCSDGYSSVKSKCHPCKNKKCKKCDKKLKKCKKCHPGKVLHNGDCIPKCPKKMYNHKGKCKHCNKPCKNCTNSKECTDCYKGYKLKNKKCHSLCPDGSVKVKGKCNPCKDKKHCVHCNRKKPSRCYKCKKPSKLFNGKCVKHCHKGTYYSKKDNSCKPCTKHCNQCLNKKHCHKCKKPKVLSSNRKKCIPHCPKGEMNHKGKCKPCEGHCKTCSLKNPKNCHSCKKPLVLYKKRCIPKCPRGTFKNKHHHCEPCKVLHCKKCINQGKTCIDCKKPKALDNNKCVPKCPKGKTNMKGKCEPCLVKHCEKCDKNVKECEKCHKPNLLISKTSCGPKCPVTMTPNSTKRKCKPCGKDCNSCKNKKHCHKCKKGTYLYKKKCVPKCPKGTRPKKSICVPCGKKYCNKCTSKECVKCQKPRLLHKGECHKKCPKGTYMDKKKHKCNKCSLHCKYCTKKHPCKKCKKPFTLTHKGTCSDRCGKGYVRVGHKCEKCKTGKHCKKCSSKDLKKCKECNKGKVMRKGKCVPNCDVGEYIQNKKCKPCSKHCKSCIDNTHCKKCKKPNHLIHKVCLPHCPKHYHSINHKCHPCSNNCDLCNQKGCIICSKGFVKENGKCVPTCSNGHYLKNKKVCKPCSKHCSKCTDKSSCTICDKGYLLKHGKCVPHCGKGYVKEAGKCKPCGSHCDHCTSKNHSICKKCKKPKVLIKGKCHHNCPIGTFKQGSECHHCMKHCKICKDKNSCIKCKKPFSLTPNKKKCVKHCSDGYHSSSGKCFPCKVEKCRKCNSNRNTCDDCDLKAFLTGKPARCLPKCPPKTIKIGRRCVPCSLHCLKCNKKECKKCKKPYILEKGKCHNVCKSGEVRVNGKCKKCKVKDCKDCKKNRTICNKCVKPLHLIKNKCHTKCPCGYHMVKGKCKKCGCKCEKCTDKNTCKKCKKGHFLSNGKCKEKCCPGTLQHKGVCHKCKDKHCKQCKNLKKNSCVICDIGYKMKHGKCVKDCGNHYFEICLKPFGKRCKPCSKHCKLCKNSKSCDKCVKPYKVKYGKCVKKCGDHYVKNDKGQCHPCTQIKACKKCDTNNRDICKKCKDKYFLENGKCVHHCSKGKMPTNNKNCIPCVDKKHCLRCDVKPTNCVKCKRPQVNQNGKCVKKCHEGYVLDPKDNHCKKCTVKKCRKCKINELDKCLDCKHKHYLHKHKCPSKCPKGTFKNGKKCSNCSVNCKVCTNKKKCNKCKKPTFLHNGKCNSTCHKGSVEINKKCVPCHDKKNCNVCSVKNQKKCKKCKKKMVIKHGKCVHKCGSGYYIKGHRCHPCEKHCKKCFNDKKCLNCYKPFLLINQDCLPRCPSGSRPMKGKCQPCKQQGKCKKCDKDIKKCEKCVKPNVLQDSKCAPNCKKAHYVKKGKCKPCSKHCLSCHSSKKCKVCRKPMKLENGKCVKHCSDGHIHIFGKCKPCKNKKCKKCSVQNTKKCKVCPKGQMLYKGQCHPKCPHGSFKASPTKCKPCSPHCLKCLNKKTCIHCKKPTKKHKGKCLVDNCPRGTVEKNGKCIKCTDTDCDECNKHNPNNCHKCAKPKVLYKKRCYKHCPKRTYRKGGKCHPCAKNCYECTKKECKKCEKHFYFAGKTKVCITCKFPKVKVGNTCKPCKPSNCLKCNKGNNKTCKICKPGFVLIKGHCLPKCPPKTYKKKQTCKPCSKYCHKCNNSHKCKKCDKGKVLYKGKCHKKCPPKHTQKKGKCIPCNDKKCEECDPKDKKKCKRCQDGTSLYKGRCVHPCPKGHFSHNGKCVPCQKSCKICDTTKCIKCKDPNVLQGDVCVPNCSKGYLNNGVRCVPCTDSNCESCLPADSCLKCKKGYFFNKILNKCVKKCEEKSYKDSKTRTCKQCSKGCEKCKNDKKCKKCIKPLILHKGKCIKKCPKQMTVKNEKCIPCSDKNCLDCENNRPSSCTNCKKPKILVNKKCKKHCPKGTYMKKRKCHPCSGKCKICNEKKCIKCKKEFHLIDGKCKNTCPNGRVPIEGKCIPCSDKKCKTCLTDVNKCIKCTAPSKLENGKCVSNCKKGTYSNKKGICVPCPEGCSRCKSKDDCKKCKLNYSLFKRKCHKECPNGFYSECSTRKCKKCSYACASCTGPTNKDCTKCAKNYLNSNGACIFEKNCLAGYYPDLKLQACVKCSIQFCKECLNNNTCTKCSRGFKFNNNNECVIGNSYIDIIRGKTLYSPYTNTHMKEIEEYSFSNNLKGVSVESNDVTFSFWLRRLLPLKNSDWIFRTQSPNSADVDIEFGFSKSHCYAKTEGSSSNHIDLGLCDYNSAYNWKFYIITVSKIQTKYKMTVLTFNGKKPERKTIELKKIKPNTIIGKDDVLQFNEGTNAFEVTQMKLFDYVLDDDSIKRFSSEVPKECSSGCAKCKNDKCLKCKTGKPNKHGQCKPSYLNILSGVENISKSTKIFLRDTKYKNMRFSDSKYNIALWFYLSKDTKLDKQTLNIANLAYDYKKVGSVTFLKAEIEDGYLSIDDNFGKPTMIKGKQIYSEVWYFLSLGVKNGQIKIYLESLDKNTKIKKTISASNDNVRLYEDFTITFGQFNGQIYNPVIYDDDLEDDEVIDIFDDNTQCQDKCVKCAEDFKCKKCQKYFKVHNGKCIDDSLSYPYTLTKRFDIFSAEQREVKIPDSKITKEFTISLWIRKKVHSDLPKNVKQSGLHRIVGLRENNSNKVESLVQEQLHEGFKSDLIFNWNPHTNDKISLNFKNTIYELINIVFIFNYNKKTLNININANNKISSFTHKFDYKFNKIILGDNLSKELNWEFTWARIYPNDLSATQIKKLRTLRPKDCNPGCIDCNYNNGRCNKCATISDHRGGCRTTLYGFKFSFLYNEKSYEDITDLSSYEFNVRNKHQVDVNSLGYSIIGYYRSYEESHTLEKGQVYQIAQVYNDAHASDIKKSPSYKMLALEIKQIKGKFQYVWEVNTENHITSIPIKGCNVIDNHYRLFYAGIDIKNKKFQYMVDCGGKNPIKGSVSLPSYPEKLQEIAKLSTFGIGTDLRSNYRVPSGTWSYLYLLPNAGFKSALFFKFKSLSRFKPIKPLPIKNCKINIFNPNARKSTCLKCIKGYFVHSGHCEKSLLSTKSGDNLILLDSILVERTKYSIKQHSLTNGQLNFSFFIRKNYFNDTNKRRIIASSGALRGYLENIDGTNKITFTFGNHSVTVGPMEKENVWHLVSVHIMGGGMTIYISSSIRGKHNYIDFASIKFTKHFKITNHIWLDNANSEIQVYGLGVYQKNIGGSILNYPLLDCSYDCDVCKENRCLACTYGTNKYGSCLSKDIFIRNRYIKGASYRFRIQSVISKYFTLRSKHFSTKFHFTLTSKQNHNQAIFKINNNKSSKGTNFISISFDQSNYSFTISYFNMYRKIKYNSPSEKIVKYKYSPSNLSHFVGLSYDGREIRYFFFNSVYNTISGTIKMQGISNHLTNDSIVEYFPNISGKGDKHGNHAIIKDLRFNYSQSHSISFFVKNARKYSRIVQNICERGSMESCAKCPHSAKLAGKYCIPKSTDFSAFSHISPYGVNRSNSKKSHFKQNFTTKKKHLTSFSFSLWFKLTSYTSLPLGIIKAKIGGNQIYKIIFDDNKLVGIGPNNSKNIITDIYKGNTIYSWIHISVSYNLKTGYQTLTVYNKGTHSSQHSSSHHKSKKLKIGKNELEYDLGFKDSKYSKSFDQSYNFEVSVISFLGNEFIQDNMVDSYRILRPPHCISCKVNCDENNICPAGKSIMSELNIGDLTGGNHKLSKNKYKTLPLFRKIGDSDKSIKSNSLNMYYILSFNMQVNRFIKSKYKTNSDTIFLITNADNKEYDSLHMTDVIPDSQNQFGVISLINNNGVLKLFIGSNLKSKEANSYIINTNGKKLNNFTEIYFAIYVNNWERSAYARLVVDNLMYAFKINIPYGLAQGISRNSRVFNHPELENFYLNTDTARLDVNLSQHYYGSKMWSRNYKSGLCRTGGKNSHCKLCYNNIDSKEYTCMNCKSKYTLLNSENGKCRKNFIHVK